MKNKLSLLSLLLIFLIGTYLRFDRLGSYPVSLNWDEVSHGYNAFSLIKTQRDEWGQKLPLIFRAFGDYKLPSYIYLSTIPIYFFGLSAFSVRFVSALSGSLAIIGIYFLTNILISRRDGKNNALNYGHLSAFFLATTPWHFFISRAALEANLSLTLIIFGLYFFLTNNRLLNNLGLVLLGISLHTYNTARIFVPALLIFIYLFDRAVTPITKKTYLGWAFFTTSVLLVIIQVLNGTGLARYDKLAILNPSVIYQIEQARNTSQLPGPISRLIHNRPVYLIASIFKNYLSYFSPPFIYQTNHPQSQFAIPGLALFTPVTILLFVVSLLGGVALLTQPLTKILFLSLLLSPLAASLTASTPQALRPNPMIFSFTILSIIGLKGLIAKAGKYSLVVLVSVVLVQVFSFFDYQKTYFTTYARDYSSSWQYGYQQAFESITKIKQSDQKLFVTKYLGEPHIFYAFYNQLNPQELFPGSPNIRFSQTSWFWTDKLSDTYFINDWLIPNNQPAKELKLESGDSISTNNSLLITSPDHLPSNFVVIDKINYPSGQPVLLIAKSK